MFLLNVLISLVSIKFTKSLKIYTLKICQLFELIYNLHTLLQPFICVSDSNFYEIHENMYNLLKSWQN